MKNFIFYFVSSLCWCLMAGCSIDSANPSATYSLEKEKVLITDDRFLIGVIAEKNEKGGWQDILPKALYYEFTLKQKGKQEDYTQDKGEIKATILPDKDLKKASIDVLGSNIFTEKNSTYGHQLSINGFDQSKTGKLVLSYYVGAQTSNNKMPLAPSDEQLKKLLNVAKDGEMVLYRNHKEIARYDLKPLKSVTKGTK
ncbi:hypothetical protein ABEP16_20640 [Priestia aryabhattai]|uniref:hypothetical protein n=1 Tax=Priestia aryabhattai TaxID=412384 RepID=UPI003D266125